MRYNERHMSWILLSNIPIRNNWDWDTWGRDNWEWDFWDWEIRTGTIGAGVGTGTIRTEGYICVA